MVSTVTIIASTSSRRTVLKAVYPPFMSLNMADQPWNLAQESPRLQKMEKAKYYKERVKFSRSPPSLRVPAVA